MKKGIDFSDALLLAFIVLKLCSVIAWSWFWVLSPFWISILFTAAVSLYKNRNDDKKDKAVHGLSKWAQRMERMKQEKENSSK